MAGGPYQNPAVVGRADELAEGEALIAALSEGPQVLVLEGEPGIGKTTVWQRLLDQAAAHDVTVLSCRPSHAEVKLAHVSLADLLNVVGDDVLAALPEPQRDASQVALLRTPSVSGPVDARAVGAGVLSVLATLADASPVIVAVDDVQWLDSASAGALRFALRRLGERPIGVLVTVRDDLDAAGDPLGLVQAFGAGVRRHRLGPLSLDHLHELIDHRFAHVFARPTLLRLQQASDGNPLFALEVARALIDAGVRPAPGEPLPVPPTLASLVQQRVAALPPETSEALLIAASTRSPDIVKLDHAAGWPTTAALRDAVAAGLITLRGDRVHFAHPMFATAVYASARAPQRRALHRRLGELATDIEERARHVALAADDLDAYAADLLELAAERARDRGAPGVAGELLEWSARLTPKDRRAATQSRIVRAAEHSFRAGDLRHARELLESSEVDLDTGRMRSRALRLLGEIHYNETTFDSAVAMLERALAQTDTAEDTAEILLDLAFAYFSVGNVDGALATAQRARQYAELLPPGPLLGETLAIEANVAFFAGKGLDTAAVERALELEDRRRNVQVLVRPIAIAALFALYAGRHADAAAEFTELSRWLSERGEDSDGLVLTWLSWAEMERGDVACGAASAERALSLATQAGNEPLRGVALMHRGKARCYLGQVAEARDDLDRSATLLERTGWQVVHAWNRWTLGHLELSIGDYEAAMRVYEPFTARIETEGILEPFSVYFVPDAAEVLITSGHLERAERLLDDFEARAQELRRTSALVGAARSRALLHAARGDATAAEQMIETSMRHANQLESPLERARTLLVRGQLHRRARRKQAARESLGQSVAIFEELAASLWVDRARAELDRIGRRASPGQLTATEERVAELAATGRTNREIATLLFISPKTVEANLARVYRKFGIRSRAELGRTMDTREGASIPHPGTSKAAR